MKKLIAFVIAVALVANTSHATFIKNKTIEKGVTHFYDSLVQQATSVYINLSRKEYEQLTGRHLSLLERITLKLSQKQMRKYDEQNPSKQFNLAGFLMGLLPGLVGALFGAFIVSTSILGFLWLGLLFSFVGASVVSVVSKDKNMHKWALIGLATYLGVALLFIIGAIIALLSCHCLG